MSASIIQQVARAMERIAPLSLAEPWDNVGILLEAVKPRTERRVLLTIDITPHVLAEALANPPSAIISYHPPIFSGLKSLTQSVPLQKTLLTVAREGISVYTPHTALDSTHEGVNWWIARAFNGMGGRWEAWDRSGGIVHLPKPAVVGDVVRAIKAHLGVESVNVGTMNPQNTISKIALCAGSGGSAIQEQGQNADCWFTGEMSHHDVLAAVAQGKTVLLCGHTNTERGYLPILRERISKELAQDGEGTETWVVDVSQADAHPLSVQ